MKKKSIEKSYSYLRRLVNIIPSPHVAALLILESLQEISFDTVSTIFHENNEINTSTITSSKVLEHSNKASIHVCSILSKWIQELNVFDSINGNLNDTRKKLKKSPSDFMNKFLNLLFQNLENAMVPVGCSIPPIYNEETIKEFRKSRSEQFDCGLSLNSTFSNKSKKRSRSNTEFENAKNLAMKQTYSKLIDAFHLRTVTQTIRCINNRKRCFEIYKLPVPTTRSIIPISASSHTNPSLFHQNSATKAKLKALKIRIQREFQIFHQGAGEESHCRVCACLRYLKGNKCLETLPDDMNLDQINECLRNSNASSTSNKVCLNNLHTDQSFSSNMQDLQTFLYLQINIGRNKKKSNKSNSTATDLSKEYIAVLRPGTTLLALATSGKIPSSLQHTPFILTAIGSALCPKDAMGNMHSNIDCFSFHQKFNSLSGADPLSLLHSAHATLQKSVVGRFAYITSSDNSNGSAITNAHDPLVGLNDASTSANVLHKKKRKKGMNHTDNIHKSYDGSAIETNKNGVIVNHSSTLSQSHKRARETELGRLGDCPKLEKVCWKWTGETCAATNCFREESIVFGDNLYDKKERDTSDKKRNDLEERDLCKIKFKCAITFEGTNVFEGLRALVADGKAKTPLPNFVRDAPMLGTNIITVKNGKSFQAQR